jgi:hypothetical protein
MPPTTTLRVANVIPNAGELVVELVPKLGVDLEEYPDWWDAGPDFLRLRMRTRTEVRYLEEYPLMWAELPPGFLLSLWEQGTAV